ncbi:sigma factor [Dietzia sp. E1]|uniref:sigma factor n=1 Tax=Dietzia sp. E1 TaxID=328361 RepID=UPI001F509925|nr:sigma factor [Dietzia sp. E1]
MTAGVLAGAGASTGEQAASPGAVPPDRVALERVRGRLLGIGYRITGTWADAEDAADEALARLVALDPADAPRNAEAWLTTVATRLCLDRLRRRKREDYIGAWLPEPVDTALLPAELAEQRDQLRIAVLLAYEQLGPDERAAFVLREAYETALRGNSRGAARRRAHRAPVGQPRPTQAADRRAPARARAG